MFNVSSALKSTYPQAIVGMLAMSNVSNPSSHPELEAAKGTLEEEIRARFAGWDRSQLKTLPVMQAYEAYYKQFKKTYHLQLQLESVALKGKSIPKVAALVEAMFMAELDNLLLTAGHDLDRVELPVTVEIASGSESYIRIGGDEQALKQGDMLIADQLGILSSIIYGPDQRTRIREETKRVLFTTYGPPGIETSLMQAHLEKLRDNVHLVAPRAQVEAMQVLDTGE